MHGGFSLCNGAFVNFSRRGASSESVFLTGSLYLLNAINVDLLGKFGSEEHFNTVYMRVLITMLASLCVCVNVECNK